MILLLRLGSPANALRDIAVSISTRRDRVDANTVLRESVAIVRIIPIIADFAAAYATTSGMPKSEARTTP